MILPGDSFGPHHWFLLSPGGPEISRKHEWKLTFATGVHPFCPCLALFTLLFRQKRNVLFFSQARIDLHLEKTCLILSLPQKAHIFLDSSYPWRKTLEQWKLPLSRSWLIQSFSDPWLARNFVIFWGQTLRLWSSHHEQKVWRQMCGYNPYATHRGQPDIVNGFFLRECPFLSWFGFHLWISPRHLRCFRYGGRLMCLLWFCLGLCLQCSSLSWNQLTMVLSSSQYQIVSFCTKHLLFGSLWGHQQLVHRRSCTCNQLSSCRALRCVRRPWNCFFLFFASRTRDERLQKHWKRNIRLSKTQVTRRFFFEVWPSKLRNSSGTWCAATHLSLFSSVNSSGKWLIRYQPASATTCTTANTCC